MIIIIIIIIIIIAIKVLPVHPVFLRHVLFTVLLSTATLWHRTPPAGSARDSCGAQVHDKMDTLHYRFSYRLVLRFISYFTADSLCVPRFAASFFTVTTDGKCILCSTPLT